MSEHTLEIDHVSKEYRLGAIGAGTLSADLNSWFARVCGREDPNRKIGDTMPTGGHEYFFALKDICLSAGRGDALALVGRNGEGKTTFARMLIGQLAPTEGSIRLGANVRVGYYAQNQDDLMEGEFTVYDTLDRVAVGDIRTRLRDILGAFLFRGEEVDKKVKVLSGGERSRLAMALSLIHI